MKTTVILPDALAEEAKQLGRQQGTTLRDLIVSGLRSEIDRRRNAARVDFHFPSVAGRGLVVGLEPADTIAASYGLDDTARSSRVSR
ncbi:MAG: hypothetical protein ACRCYX_14730 [Dermatophilaceae bacterium]